MTRLIAANIRPLLIGSGDRPSKGITLRYPSEPGKGFMTIRFVEIPLDYGIETTTKYDGFLLLSYKWKEKKGEERDEDTIFLGVRGQEWGNLCSDHRTLKRFLDEVISLHAKERGIVILSYKPKTFRNITIDRNGPGFKVKNNKRAECLFNKEKIVGDVFDFKMFSFIPRGTFAVNSNKYTEMVRNCILNNTRFVDI